MTDGKNKENRMRKNSVTAALAAASMLLAGCSGSGASNVPAATKASAVSQDKIDAAMGTATTLNFWTWVPKIQDEIDRVRLF